MTRKEQIIEVLKKHIGECAISGDDADYLLFHLTKDILSLPIDVPSEEEIEDYMRNVIFHSTLEWQSRSQFNKAARMAYKDIIWMRSSEGQAYMKQINEAYIPELDIDCLGNCFSDADPGL